MRFFLIFLLSLLVSTCAKKKEEGINQETAFMLFVLAQPAKGCGNTEVTSNGQAISFSSGSTYTICGEISTTSVVTVAQAGTYKITAAEGLVTYSSRGCNSISDSITVALRNSDNSVLTSGSSKTFAANETITITTVRPSSTKYTCTGYSVSQSTSRKYTITFEQQ